MLRAFIFGPVAVTVGYWEQRGAEVEAGARVEVRRVEYEQIPGAPGGVAGLRLMPVTHGIWRADLFTGPQGAVYHYHPAFRDGDVGSRFLDDGLTRDPVAWTIGKLADLPALVRGSRAADVADGIHPAEVEQALPQIREAIEQSFAPLEAPPQAAPA